MLSVSITVGQESEHNLAQCLWLRGPHEAAIKLLARAAIISDSAEAEGSVSQVTHVAIARRQFLAMWTSP